MNYRASVFLSVMFTFFIFLLSLFKEGVGVCGRLGGRECFFKIFRNFDTSDEAIDSLRSLLIFLRFG